MSKPQSIKTQPWTQFDRQSYFFINQEYSHQKLFVTKLSQKLIKSTLDLKFTLNKNDRNMKYFDQFKFWFTPNEDKTFYLKIKDNKFKLHYDNGIIQPTVGHKFNFYGSLQSQRDLTEKQLKIGLCYLTNQLMCNNRLRLEKFYPYLIETETTYYHKSQYLKNNWKLAMYWAVNLYNKKLLKNGLLFGYKKDNGEYTLRADSNGWRERQFQVNFQDYFYNLTFDYVRKLNQDLKIGIQVDLLSWEKTLDRVTAAIQKNYPQNNVTLKCRMSSDLNFAFTIKRKIGTYGTTSIGAQISDIGTVNRINFGTKVELNL